MHFGKYVGEELKDIPEPFRTKVKSVTILFQAKLDSMTKYKVKIVNSALLRHDG